MESTAGVRPIRGSVADQRWSEPDIDAWLEQASELWLTHHAESLGDWLVVPTSENEFLWRAEAAFARMWKRRPAPPEPADDRPPVRGFHLYRLWGADDRLLYVGVSRALRGRLRTHHRTWPGMIHRTTWEEHESAESMLAAETKAIAEELPALNVAKV